MSENRAESIKKQLIPQESKTPEVPSGIFSTIYEQKTCILGSIGSQTYKPCIGPRCGHWNIKHKSCGFALIGDNNES